jgi:acyl transferase domain-containing protein/phosphopantetheinyl transferase (holo-ACP synthase)
MRKGRPYEIAIIGMGCRFPGASDLSDYFENILSARDCTREVPPDRWSAARFCDPQSQANDRVPSCRGGYLDSPLSFDAAAHGIMPRTVDGGEPEQCLVLDATITALADAGLAIESLKDHRVETVIGRGNYFNRGNLTRLQHGRMIDQILMLLAAVHPEWSQTELDAVRADLRASLPPFEAATIPGQLTNATAGRIAHRLDLSGASFVVDAASASSLVAVDLAARALVETRADLAIAGGVYLEADLDFPLVFRQLNALSPSGTARPFAADADGMVPGEGVGVVVLKRRADAERDGDRIYAVIQGIGLASDGKSQGLAAPSARGHARAIRRAYRGAGIDPATVMLVEGHGLGVPAADRAELRALGAVFPALPYGKRALGAVSSMIGHAMPAAGMAGLIKSALALFHRVLPPTLHAEHAQPLLAASSSAFALNPTARPWIHADEQTPRRAGVNAFGFAGINAHAVLEEHTSSADGSQPGALRKWETEAILFSAPDRLGLINQVNQLLSWMAEHTKHALLDIAYTLNSRHGHPSDGVRLGMVASSRSELTERLKSVLPRLADPTCRSIRDARGVYFWNEPLLNEHTRGLAFLFPGEGSQYPGMLADLCLHFPEVRVMFDTADRIARDLGEIVPPSEHLFGPVPGGDEKLWSTATAVNVVLNAQWALYQVLTRLGLYPDAVLGHSSGEILALSAAGVFETDRTLERELGRLGAIMSGFESSGDLPAARLLAVATHRNRAEAICRDLDTKGVEAAMDNCPHQVVLAVPVAELPRLTERLRLENILFEELPFSRAYHTPSFRPVVGPIAEFFEQMNFRRPKVPIYSCASRGRMPGSPDAIRDLAVAQWTQTVAFRETIEAMHADGLRLFIDVGARGNLAGFVEDTLRGKPAFAVAANLPRRAGVTQLNHLVAATFAHGASLNTNYLYARRRPCAIDWNTPEPPSRATVELKIGFPEMKLSAELIERLGTSKRQTVTQEVESVEAISRIAAHEPDDRVAHEHRNGNGFTHQERIAPAAHNRMHESRFDTQELTDPEPMTLEWAGPGQEEHWDQPLDDASGDDHAMICFQDTMQSFLRTQREVMAAYLGASTASSLLDDGACVASPSSVPGDTVFPEPGPWAGEILRLVAGAEVETRLILEAHDDPIAQHHTLGGRKISARDPSLLGLPVLPFAVMAEMTAQVAAIVVEPGMVLTGLRSVRAHKWVRYEDEPVYLELRGHRVPSEADDRVWVGIFNRGTDGEADAPRPVFEAIAVFAESVPPAPAAVPWSLENARPSKFTARSVYAEQWLFHGPLFQAIAHMGKLSDKGIEGRLRVLPLEPLVKAGQPATFHTDLVVVDNFTQLLGAWGLDYLAEGDVMFPLHMEELEIHGARPPVGTEVACQITIHELERHRIRVEAQFTRPDGTVWMRINDWEDWRFHWPGRYRDSFRQPRDYLVGEDLPVMDPGDGAPAGARAVWLEPPADMGRPVWRDVLEFTQLGPDERVDYLATAGTEERRSQRLWGRIAAKEAARRLWNDAGHPPVYPADLAIVTDERGRPCLNRLEGMAAAAMPAISIAHAEGVAIALAVLDPTARVGIDVEPIIDRPATFLVEAFTPRERALLDRWTGPSRSEWIARFWCAKVAAAKASGMGLAGRPAIAEVVDFHEDTGVVHVRLAPEGLAPGAENAYENPLRVISARRGQRAWAWTIRKGINS